MQHKDNSDLNEVINSGLNKTFDKNTGLHIKGKQNILKSLSK